ncbi:MAG: hypothetical protein Q8P18_01765 [Pseudomonadota bacterium]|nr:hypothetical protein [Pseudomonadota bacterium]
MPFEFPFRPAIVREGENEYLIRTLNEFRSVDDVRALEVRPARRPDGAGRRCRRRARGEVHLTTGRLESNCRRVDTDFPALAE